MVTLTLTTRQRFHLDVRLLQDTNRKSHIVSQMQLTIGVLFWWPEVRQVLLYTYRLWHPAMQLLHYRYSGLVNTQAIPKVNNLEHRLQWLQYINIIMKTHLSTTITGPCDCSCSASQAFTLLTNSKMLRSGENADGQLGHAIILTTHS